METDRGPADAKLLGYPEGPQALFCEWVGTQAAAWLGLPTFEVAVVGVTEADLITYADGTTSEAGSAFVARQETGTPWGGTAEELAAIENQDVLSGLMTPATSLADVDGGEGTGGLRVQEAREP